MNQGLENMLAKRFPWAYNKNINSEKSKARVYCCCDDGWFVLIWRLLEEIEEHYRQNNANINKLSIDDIKEKYGGLRVYTSNVLPGVDEIIQRYEDESETICEICGGTGWLHEQGEWLKTLCANCALEKGYTPVRD